MKLGKMVWTVGAVTAFALGLSAEACSSSQGTGTTGGGGCAELSVCCATLSGTNQSACTTLVAGGNDTNCASFLAQAQGAGSCTGVSAASNLSSVNSTQGSIGQSSTSSVIGTSGASSSSSAGNSGSGSSSGSCEKPPQLYPETGSGGMYCPFSAPAGGKASYCTAGQFCCETPASAGTLSTCSSSACAAGDTSWGCEGTPDCASQSGTICCVVAKSGSSVTVGSNPACGSNPAFPYLGGFAGTACSATCASGYQICQATSDCSGGKTCVAIKPEGNSVGFCQ